MLWSRVFGVVLVAVLFHGLTQEETIASNEIVAPKFPGDVMDLRDVKSPRLTGLKLKLFAKLIRVPVLNTLLLKRIKSNNGMIQVREFASTLDDEPMHYPIHISTPQEKEKHEQLAQGFDANALRFEPIGNNLKFKRWTIQDYTDKYKSGEVTPLQVAKAVIAAIDDSNAKEIPLRAFVQVNKTEILREAQLSTLRYASGKTVGPLDGVPVAVKDGLDVTGYAVGFGTGFIAALNGPATKDAIPVARLRAAGALIIGMNNMHECGQGTTGINPHHGTPRNPYAATHMTGGSSSGSAAAVAAGIVPLAVAVDGGGSTRIPAGLCGVVGVKASYQRIPAVGLAAPSLAFVGPIAGSVQDAALGYAIMGGAHEAVPMSQLQPPVHINPTMMESKDLSSVRIGVYRDYLNGTDKEIVDEFWANVEYLKSLGATIVDITLPNLQTIHFSHSITVLSESGQNSDDMYDHASEYGSDVQINAQLARTVLTALDFMAAQRVRGYAMRMLRDVFNDVDIIFTPTTGVPAPKLDPDVFAAGLSDLQLTVKLMRYILLGNFAGIPSVTAPVAYTKTDNLPISMLFQSFHYNEHDLFHLARVLEKKSTPSKPASYYYSILDDAKKM